MTAKRTVVLLIMALGFLLASPLSAQTRSRSKRIAAKNQAPPTPVPEQSPAPLTPAQLPAVPPQVSYTNGQLTIIAQNSTLGDILHAVRQKTGADIDVPANATERVVGRMGPGPARDVLASLLNGSHFDYVMTGSPQNPTALQHVLLMPKAATPGSAPVSEANAGQPGAPAPQNQAGAVPQPQGAPEQPGEDISSTDDLNNDQDLAQDQPAQDEGQQQAEQQQADQAQQQQPGTFNGQPGIKTPEQLLQELQQRQAQQQQPGAPQGAPPQAAPQGFPIPPGAQPPQQQQPQQQPPQ